MPFLGNVHKGPAQKGPLSMEGLFSCGTMCSSESGGVNTASFSGV